MKISMSVNGKAVSAEVETRTLLVTFIREDLRLTGTHVGCDTSQCGACTVLMNGRAVKSCNMLAVQAEGADIVTIEGLAQADGTLHPDAGGVPRAPWPAVRLLHPRHGDERHRPGEESFRSLGGDIRAELDGNLCRCTGYHNIVKAIKAAAAKPCRLSLRREQAQGADHASVQLPASEKRGRGRRGVAQGADAKLLAGGQSLVAAMKLRLSAPSDLVDLGGIEELTGIKVEGERASPSAP